MAAARAPRSRRERRVDVEQVATAVDELRLLWPRLADALERDHAPGGDGRGGAATVPRLPVNTEVLAAIADLATAIPHVEAKARIAVAAAAGRSPHVQTRPVAAALAGLTATMSSLDACDRAGALLVEREVYRWHRVAREAIGLTTSGTALDVTCPVCPDDDPDAPPGRLRLAGDEATLRLGAREPVTWRRGDRIACPACKASWSHVEWPFLRRLIDAREQQQTEREVTEQ